MSPRSRAIRASFHLGSIGVIGALAALAACSSSSKLPPTDTSGTNNAPPGGTTGPDADGGPSTTTGSSCSVPSSPIAFTLPALNQAPSPAFPLTADSLSCPAGSNKLTYSLLDVNGDSLPDLVVTAACDNASVGATEWVVYLNTGAGFSTTATNFALPPQPSTAGCAGVFIADVNGDLKPDYVETSLCTDSTVGTTHWLVYANSGTGFAQTSASYVLPPSFSTGAFASTSAATPTCTGGKNVPAFQLVDLNGDGYLDFVVTQSCTDTTVGTSNWSVYFGSLAGAAQTASSFALPTTPTVTAGAYAGVNGTLSCTSTVTRPAYWLFDFDLDDKPDLVVTQQCTDTTIGSTAWQWYRNSGTAFATTPGTIALPTFPTAPTGSFAQLSGVGTCANGAGAPTYVLADLTGTSQIDLLVTRDCGDALSGASYWDVYPDVAGQGFTAPREKLPIPQQLGATTSAPAGLSGTANCTAPATPSFTTTYIAGTSLDLVLTSLCSDTTVGSQRWLLFPVTCP